MPSATLTVREVKNKETGLDISIPTYKETPGLLGSTVEFNVVVVSRLSFFKSPKHKETDVVQFMVSRKYPDFEHLFNQLSEQFSGTVLPPLPKKVLRLTEAVIKDRKSKLENFLKFLACTPKLATSSKLLEFLGVNAIKAGRYRKGEVGEAELKGDSDEKPAEEEEPVTMGAEENLFGETEEVDEVDMFGGGDEQDIFTSASDNPLSETGAEVRLFEEQDFGGGVQEGEEEELLGFVPDARISDRTVSNVGETTGDEDTSDLLRIEDDLDKFLVMETKTSHPPEEVIPAGSREEVPVPESQTSPKPKPNPKPGLSQKPALAQKPNLKPKPQIPGKKPVLPRKPSQENPTDKKADVKKQEEITPSKGDNPAPALAEDDILKYIQENVSAGDEDLDLFS